MLIQHCGVSGLFNWDLEPVYEQIQAQPDDVNKVPVPGSAFKTEVIVGSEVTANQAEQNDGKEGGAQNNVEAVETSEHVEQRAIGTRVKTQVQLLVSVMVFAGLAGNKDETQNDGSCQPEDGFTAMAGTQGMVCDGQGEA